MLLALTLGLLLFLLSTPAQEGLETAGGLPGSYQGVALFVAAAVGAYLVLECVRRVAEERGARRARGAGIERARCWRCSSPTGIGLHNFGEGLAIGAAFALGEAALGTLLVIGFTLHNTTEGLAIVAPLAKERPSLGQLARLGPIGGLPTIAGAWVGGIVYSPVLAVLFLGFGAGAIAQVAAADRAADGRHALDRRSGSRRRRSWAGCWRASRHVRHGVCWSGDTHQDAGFSSRPSAAGTCADRRRVAHGR